jgi:hypothetical protein
MLVQQFPISDGVNLVIRTSRVIRGICYVCRDDDAPLPDGQTAAVFGSIADRSEQGHAAAEAEARAYGERVLKELQ